MARKRETGIIPLKQVRKGDVFAFPLEDGRWGACRVVGEHAGGERRVLAACSPWVGDSPPSIEEPLLREVLRLTHPAWDDEEEVAWINEPVPADFVRVGQLPVEEKFGEVHSYSGWTTFPMQVFLQWRWDHDREAVEAEDEAERRESQQAAQAARTSYQVVPGTTLADLRGRTHLKGWVGYAEPEFLRPARKVIRDLIDDLAALGPDAPDAVKFDRIRLAVEAFNTLDEEGLDIDTMAREDLYELFGEIADRVGLEDYGEDLICWRDW